MRPRSRSRSHSLSTSHSGGGGNEHPHHQHLGEGSTNYGDDSDDGGLDGSIRDLVHAPDVETASQYYYNNTYHRSDSFRGLSPPTAPLHDPHALLEASTAALTAARHPHSPPLSHHHRPHASPPQSPQSLNCGLSWPPRPRAWSRSVGVGDDSSHSEIPEAASGRLEHKPGQEHAAASIVQDDMDDGIDYGYGDSDDPTHSRSNSHSNKDIISGGDDGIDNDEGDDEEEYPEHPDDASVSAKRASTLCDCFTAFIASASRAPTQLAEAVARFAPCFWCWGFQHRTARVVLRRLNVLLVLMALYQVGAGIFLGIVILSETLVDRTLPYQGPLPEYDDDVASYNDTAPNSDYIPHGNVLLSVTWNLNGKIFLASLVAAYLCAFVAVTWRVVRYVNLVVAVRYYWALAWAAPFQTFCVIGLFDYFDVTQVWVDKWWRDGRLAWFRYQSCPSGTYQTSCTVPDFGNATEEVAWCRINYNATDCTEIRDQAQYKTLRFLKGFYFFTGGWGLVLLLLVRESEKCNKRCSQRLRLTAAINSFPQIFLAMDTLEQIISKPLVQKSRQSNIPGWLSLPMLTCLGVGVILILFEDSTTGKDYLSQFQWMGSIYVSISGLFFAAGLLGKKVEAIEERGTPRNLLTTPHSTVRPQVCTLTHRQLKKPVTSANSSPRFTCSLPACCPRACSYLHRLAAPLRTRCTCPTPP